MKFLLTEQYGLELDESGTSIMKVHFMIENCFRIPETIVKLCRFSFANIPHVSEIVVPSSVNVIEDGAFCNCKRLERIVFEKRETPILFGNQVFFNCPSLLDISIPEGTTHISNRLIEDCPNLEIIHLPSSLSEIKESTAKTSFSGLTNLRKFIVGENSQNYFDFRGILFSQTSLVKVPQNYRCQINGKTNNSLIVVLQAVSTICANAFRGTNIDDLDCPKNICFIDSYAFADCHRLSYIDLSLTSVSCIRMGTFSNCDHLIKVKLPISSTIIGPNAFEYCSRLESITLSPRVWRIKKDAFIGCSSLKEIIFDASETCFDRLNFDRDFNLPENEEIVYKMPHELLDSFKKFYPNKKNQLIN